MSQTTRERVVKTIAAVLGPEFELDESNLELESIKMLELIVGLEQEFGIEIAEDAPIARITSSIDAIVAYVDRSGNRLR
jgi:acyl carrier protein